MEKRMINVALVGAGWAGAMHATAYNRVCGVPVRRKTVCALEPTLPEFAEQYGFEEYTDDFSKVLQDEEIDVVDIVTPPNLHESMVIAALQAGKHVICEKPLTGYFGMPEDEPPIGQVPKTKMLKAVQKTCGKIEEALAQSGKKFFYAENWVYAPAFVRAVELILKKGTTVLQISGEIGHKGSHADYVRYWRKSGGGTLARNLIHPLTAAVYLKKKELEAKGKNYGVKSLVCDCSMVTKDAEKRYILADPADVEDWSHMVLTFNDGSKAILTATDIYLGEMVNSLSIYGNDAVLKCNFTPNNLLNVYFSDEQGIESELIMEKSDHNIGHQSALVADDFLRGYFSEIQDFMECIYYDRQPQCGFELAKEAIELIYRGYCASEMEEYNSRNV